MLQKLSVLALLMASTVFITPAQDCKLRFSVVFNDGEKMQVGLTSDQKKMWDHDAAKKYKGLCLDDKAPDFIILWNQGLNGSELAKASVDRFNELRNTAPIASSTNMSSQTFNIRPSSQVRGKAIYYVLDTSKKPYPMLHQGEGYQDVPQGSQNAPGQSIKTSDLASTIPDPVEALSNALKWLKKDKKI